MPQNSQPLDLEEALTRLQQQIVPIHRHERVDLVAARNRYLAEVVDAPLDMPPFAASAMDGYAVRAADWQQHPDGTFQQIGESLAGHPFTGTVNSGECVRIFTGAMVPAGADQILLQEEVADVDGSAIRFNPHRVSETYVRPIGHDMQHGHRLLHAGVKLSALMQGMLASAGVSSVSVCGKPRVGVFSTGDELVDAGNTLQPGQIYDSNRLTVLSLLADDALELIDLGRLADDPAEVHAALESAAAQCDMLITSGGVSVGDADFITNTIQNLGEMSFWRLNLKPGKPLAYGRIGQCHIFGLPGNPVSTIVTLLLLARPALQHLAGGEVSTPLRVPAVTTALMQHTPGRAEYQSGVLSTQASQLMVSPTGDQSSNRMTTFAAANCLAEIPKEAGDLPAGSTIQVLPFHGLL
ncbi:MAG: gephyrin-like molybdotransferase Glp [Pseudomonadota bacterium]